MNKVLSVLRADEGQSMVEYGFIMVLIVAAVMVGVAVLGTHVVSMYQHNTNMVVNSVS